MAVAYSEPCETFKMELCMKIVNGKAPNYFGKKLHLSFLTGFCMRLWKGCYFMKHSKCLPGSLPRQNFTKKPTYQFPIQRS